MKALVCFASVRRERDCKKCDSLLVCFQVCAVMNSVSYGHLSQLFFEMEVGQFLAIGSQMWLRYPWAFLLKRYVRCLHFETTLKLGTCLVNIQIFLSCAGIYKISSCLEAWMTCLSVVSKPGAVSVIWAEGGCASWLVWIISYRRKQACRVCSSHGHQLFRGPAMCCFPPSVVL